MTIYIGFNIFSICQSILLILFVGLLVLLLFYFYPSNQTIVSFRDFFDWQEQDRIT